MLQSQKNNWIIILLKMYFTAVACLQFNQPCQLNLPAAASLTFCGVKLNFLSQVSYPLSAFFMAIFSFTQFNLLPSMVNDSLATWHHDALLCV
jgi:hypothetical protein